MIDPRPDPHPEIEGYNPMTKQLEIEKEMSNKRIRNIAAYKQQTLDEIEGVHERERQGIINDIKEKKKKYEKINLEERLKSFGLRQNSNNSNKSKESAWKGPNTQTRVKNALGKAYTRGVNGLRGIFKSKTGTTGGRTRRRKRRRKTKRR